ncbi:E3 SUMO-protein ligase ZBED1-like [Drosophila bipectinata]|uniref:E3 SUMO-protein ligase ZBED1-like n=1 Tax=Drosophila bipectinata TaxID=42026 RepID=UPI001C89728D|nr:zinc finger BED domain-containing protein 4-like isoform X1 [Drosophila bipectinata]
MSAKIYFGEIKNSSATCTICSKIVKTSGNTSNLLSHLKNRHRDAYLKCVKKTTKLDKPTKIEHMSNENAFKSSSTSKEKNDDITEACVFMICKNNLPVRSVEKEGLTKLLNTCVPKYKIPSRFKVTDLFEAKYESCVAKMKNLFRNVKDFAFTCDGVTITNSTRSYHTVTAHFINNNSLQSVCLQAVRMTQDSRLLTNENLSDVGEMDYNKMGFIEAHNRSVATRPIVEVHENQELKLFLGLPFTSWESDPPGSHNPKHCQGFPN